MEAAACYKETNYRLFTLFTPVNQLRVNKFVLKVRADGVPPEDVSGVTFNQETNVLSVCT